jgi:hypothetical protein
MLRMDAYGAQVSGIPKASVKFGKGVAPFQRQSASLV